MDRRDVVVGGLGAALTSTLGEAAAPATGSSSHAAVERATAEHYTWGKVSEGWRFLNRPDLSVIQERVPPGAGEVRHRHLKARQFFYVLTGAATLEFDDGDVDFGPGQGVEVAPGLRHRFINRSDQDVVFLTISAPTTTGDRIED
jgi:mannose-6-phosphate isomerase-like protein (cupin superfamily)